MFQNVSAHTGEGINELLEKILLQSEMLELSANPKVPAEGVVLEAYLDKGRGPVANVLVRNGTLQRRRPGGRGQAWGKVKAMSDDRGRQLREADPATPIEILGLSEVPSAGESFYVVTDVKKAQEIADTKKRAESAAMPTQARMGLDQIHQMMQSGEVHELKLIIKADVQGSIEALVKALTDLSHRQGEGQRHPHGCRRHHRERRHAGHGVQLHRRSASTCAQPARRARWPSPSASTCASTSIIYEAVDEVKKAMAGMLAPNFIEKPLGKAEVRQVFTIPKIGAIAGSYVQDGKIVRNGKARVLRDRRRSGTATSRRCVASRTTSATSRRATSAVSRSTASTTSRSTTSSSASRWSRSPRCCDGPGRSRELCPLARFDIGASTPAG